MSRTGIKTFENKIFGNIETMYVKGQIWFKGNDVATALQYQHPAVIIHKHVDIEYKKSGAQLRGVSKTETLSNNDLKTFWISEPGLYKLIFSSHMAEAKAFTKWVVEEVIPSIRKTGTYTLPQVIKSPQIQILNETNLHYKVIDFIRKYHPEAILIPGLGEHQITTTSRSDAYYKGYKGGQPDILILNRHKTFSGMAIELKTPTGKGIVSENQRNCLDALKLNNYKVLISNDYDEIIVQVMDYAKDFRLQCTWCSRCFKTKDTLRNHLVGFHKVEDVRL